jgi:adenylate kinase
MLIVVTGQVGLDKKSFLQQAAGIAADRGSEVTLCNVGDMMYAEAPDVAAGRILDLPLSRLRSIRRSVFKDVLAACRQSGNVIVNTHATFRWRHGLFYAFDYDQMKALGADLYVTLVDSIDRIHYRLARDGYTNHTLKDVMVWREEEILATELLSQILGGHGQFYILARGADGLAPEGSPAEALARLLDRPQPRKAYLSFPMSHVNGSSSILAEIESFRRTMKRHFMCFDPADVEEKELCALALQAVEAGQRTIQTGPPGQEVALEAAEVVGIIPDIDGQIYARDFKLIDQADMIISLIPELDGGRPGLSSGVERELQHAHEATREVFIIWRPRVEPSPFVSETATRIFPSVEEAVKFFHDAHMIARPPGGLFKPDAQG